MPFVIKGQSWLHRDPACPVQSLNWLMWDVGAGERDERIIFEGLSNSRHSNVPAALGTLIMADLVVYGAITQSSNASPTYTFCSALSPAVDELQKWQPYWPLARPPVDLVRAVDLAGPRGRSEWSQDMVPVGQIYSG
ncbi:MAG: hypothetical protein L6R42_004175 [Xanthoria sp. 1 TBL-2021]|nr:MAG: hypothetical protein L6R42_004175 [Xanthoria sp. 1 TBL-2021]